MKRFISVFVALIILVSLFATVAYATPPTQPGEISPIGIEEDNILTNNMEDRGIIMTVEDFIENYVGDNYSQAAATATSMQLTNNPLSTPAIQYSNIEYNAENRNITFTAQISINGTTADVQMGGTLYSSWKMDHGINSIVGEITSNSSNIEVLQFEIYNDDDNSKLYSPFPMTEGPVLKLYLLVEDSLYFFETDIPTAMACIEIENVKSNKTEKGWVDGFWFDGIIAPEYSESTPVDSVSLLVQDYPDTVSFPTITASWTISNVEYIYCTTPGLYYRFTDVNAATYTWIAHFKLLEAYTEINGYRQESGNIRIQNIRLSFATGPYTMIMNATPYIDMEDTLNSLAVVSEFTGLASIAAMGLISGIDEVSDLTVIAAEYAFEIIDMLQESDYTSRDIATNQTIDFVVEDSDVGGRGFSFHAPSRYYLLNTENKFKYEMEVTASNYSDPNASSGIRSVQLVVEYDYCSTRATANISSATPDPINQSYYCDLGL